MSGVLLILLKGDFQEPLDKSLAIGHMFVGTLTLSPQKYEQLVLRSCPCHSRLHFVQAYNYFKYLNLEF